MTENLSQKDIDQLVSKRSEKETSPAEDFLNGKTVFKYNFKSHKKINKNQFLLLENIHRRFLRNIEGTLTNLLNIPVIANLTTSTELTYSEFADSITPPTCVYLLTVQPNHGSVMIEMDSKFAFFVIDKVLGGSLNGTSNIERELSLIEERILSRIVKLILKDLADAWAMVAEISFDVDGFYSQSDYIQVISSNQKIYLASVDIRGDMELGYMNLCFPVDVLEPFIANKSERLSKGLLQQSEREKLKNVSIMQDHIKRSRVCLKTILGEAALTVDEYNSMQSGDVIRLDTRVDSPVKIMLGDSKIGNAERLKSKFITLRLTDQS